MFLSLIAPCFNEADNLPLFFDMCCTQFGKVGVPFEIVFIDDGSSDGTLAVLKKLYAEQIVPVKVITFSRNFGKEAALYAGLQYADGDYICLIDTDLQQTPETVLEMLSYLKTHEDYDVCAAYQEQRKENACYIGMKKAFYSIINKLSDVSVRPDASDFRLFRRNVKDSILALKEYHRFSKGIFAWVGYRTCFIPYTAQERAHGTSKWGFKKLVNYALEGIIGYSTAPLRIATWMGGCAGTAAVLYLIFVILEKLIWGIDVPGYATIIVLLLFFSSLQLFCIGIIGEYVGRTFEQSKNRPIFIARDIMLPDSEKK